MKKYLRIPAPIEAIQWDGIHWDEVCEFAGSKVTGDVETCKLDPKRMPVIVHTQHGDVRAEIGDWIAKDAVGEFYPIAKDVFEKTYREVDAPIRGAKKGESLPYEQAAEQAAVMGWACRRCGRFYANFDGAEHLARMCCSDDHPCERKCGNRAPQRYTICPSCRNVDQAKVWDKMEAVDWDGKAPIAVWQDDTYFFSIDDLNEYIEEHEISNLDELSLVLCRPNRLPKLDLFEYLGGLLPEGVERLPDGYLEVEKAFDEYVKAHQPWCWVPDNKKIKIESLKALGIEPYVRKQDE